MRRLMLLIAAGSLWLFLAAVPVFADGGPHVASVNNGTAGVNADSCAGCHRAHTAQGEYLLVASSANRVVPDLSRLDRPRCDDRRRERRAVRARRPIPSAAARCSGTSAAAASSTPVSGRARPFASPTPSGERCSPARQGAGPDRRVPARHLGPPAERRTAWSGRRTFIAWGNGPDSASPYAGPIGQGRVRDLPQPARERAVPHPQPHPEPGRATRHRRVRSGSVARATSPTRRLPPAGDNRNYTIIQTERRHRHAPREPGGGAQPAGDGGRLLAAQGPVERHEPARPTTRRTGSPRPSTTPDLGVVPDVPHALPQRRAGTSRPPTRSTSTATPRTQPPGTASRATWHMVRTPR